MEQTPDTPDDGNVREHAVQSSADNTPPPRPLSGPGASRQTRRLQLRNTGFRAAAVPSRKVTPKSLSSGSTDWSTTHNLSSDAENVSPAGAARAVPGNRRKSSGVLREISNPTTLTRPRKQKPKIKMDQAMFNPAMANYGGVYADAPLSPPMPPGGIKTKSAKTRAKMKRTSMSAEHSKHIEFLETELEAAQCQLRAHTSPTVTKQRATHMRSLSTETKQLHEDLAMWERKFDERVQATLDPYLEIELELRSRVRGLEEEGELFRYRIGELEGQLDTKTQSMESIEAANLDLENRLEIMAKLLAFSPTKFDRFSDKPTFNDMGGIRRSHLRPKSMLPRFPTVSSLITSPEHRAQMRFSASHVHSTPSPMRGAFQQPRLSLDTNVHHSDVSSDAASVFSEAPMTADSMTSEDASDQASGGFNPWTINAVQNARSRPARRMRRFGAGSVGMKPLILPAASHGEQVPTPAIRPMLYERRGTMPSLGPSSPGEEVKSPSSSAPRRRAGTDADRSALANLTRSSFDASPHASDGRASSYGYPSSHGSQMTTRNFSSLGTVSGRNLMDELSAARASQSPPSCEEEYTRLANHITTEAIEYDASSADDASLESYLLAHSSPAELTRPSPPSSEQSALRSSSTETAIQPRSCQNSLPLSRTSAMTRLRLLFGDLWRSPVLLVRHLVLIAQSRMRIPEPLRNVQWWLLGVLLGPMARRRMANHASSLHCGSSPAHLERQALIGSESGEGDMAYGTTFDSPRPASEREVMSGIGRKRALADRATEARKGQCCVHHARAKHSPWMWLQFSITLAFAVGVAFKDGPGSLLKVPCVPARSE